MPLHPQAVAFLEAVADAPPLDTLTPEQNRAGLAPVIPLSGDPRPMASVEDRTVTTATGPVPVRVYRPRADPGLPVVAYFHGGGWVVGDLESHDTTCRDLAGHADAVVVAVHFRRAPEHPFPAAYEDCVGVARALLENGGGLEVDPSRVAVCGDSAGGNLAAVAALALRGVGAGLAHQALIYPVTDAAGVGATASYDAFGTDHFLTTRDMAYFVRSYAGATDPADPRLSPLRADDLAGAASASVLVGGCDPLRDEGVAYAERLRAADVDVELREYAGQVHPFVLLAGILDDAVDARAWLGGRLRAALHG